MGLALMGVAKAAVAIKATLIRIDFMLPIVLYKNELDETKRTSLSTCTGRPVGEQALLYGPAAILPTSPKQT